jgi:hypothetical protein
MIPDGGEQGHHPGRSISADRQSRRCRRLLFNPEARVDDLGPDRYNNRINTSRQMRDCPDTLERCREDSSLPEG